MDYSDKIKYGLKAILVLCFSTVAVMANAETVTQKEAKRIARLFFNDAYGQVCPDPEYVYNGKRLTTDRLFTPFYIFNSPEGGFVMISAENKAFPILGYSLMPKGQGFSKEKMTQEDRELMTRFSRDIELIRFDSRYPLQAAEAWENIPQTIHDILYSPSLLADGYLRYRPSDDKMWVVRERAVEFPYEWPKTDEELRLEREASVEEEYVPFSFYEDFLAETEREKREKFSELEERLRPSKPIIKSLGGAHFTIDMPREIEVVDIYNAEGQLYKRYFFRGVKSLPINLSDFPTGFYFALLREPDGHATGIKLYR